MEAIQLILIYNIQHNIKEYFSKMQPDDIQVNF